MFQFTSNRTKIFVSTSAIVVLAGISIFLGIVPLITQVRKSQDQITINQQQAAALTQTIGNFQELSTKLQQIGDQAQTVLAIFPSREDSVSLVEGLEAAAAKAGVAPLLVIVDNQENAGSAGISTPPPTIKNLQGIEEVPYVLRFSSDYRKLVNFLLALENTPFFTEVTNVGLNADIAGTQKGNSVVKTGTATVEIKGVLFINNNQL